MKAALLPVKEPSQAKQRLAHLLSVAEREQLAFCMFDDVMNALTAADGLDLIAVISSNRTILGQAEKRGALALKEREQRGHSHSADSGAKLCMSRGVETLLMVPIDVPLIKPSEIEELLVPGPDLIIVPSADGTGTNALVRTPPDVIESRFGPGSFAAHRAQAEAKGLSYQVRRPSGLTFDIDTPEDLAVFLSNRRECKSYRLLMELNIKERLN